MTPHLSFDVDPVRSLIRITLGGFFEPADVQRLVRERDAAHLLLRCAPNRHLTLVDMREMQIQPQASVEAFHAVLADPRTASRKLAFVAARSLARSQVKRAAEGRNAAYFATVEEAEAWLLSGDDW